MRNDFSHQWVTRKATCPRHRVMRHNRTFFFWLKIRMKLIIFSLLLKLNSDWRVNKCFSMLVKTLVWIWEISQHLFTEIAAHGETDAWGLFCPSGRLRLKALFCSQYFQKDFLIPNFQKIIFCLRSSARSQFYGCPFKEFRTEGVRPIRQSSDKSEFKWPWSLW